MPDFVLSKNDVSENFLWKIPVEVIESRKGNGNFREIILLDLVASGF